MPSQVTFAASEITRRDAADRQLKQAIRLFFDRGDMLAVHTLTGAAFQLLADIGKVSGIVSRFRSTELIRPERMKEWIQALNSTQNFLKHADKDGALRHNYVEEATVLFLYEAIELAQRVSPATGGERLAFQLWFVFSYPEMVDQSFLARLEAVNTSGINQADRDLWAQWLRKASAS